MENRDRNMNVNEIITVGYQMKKLCEKKSNHIMEEYDLRNVELDILSYLSRAHDRNTAKDITNARSLSKAHISKSVEHLKAKGYVIVNEDCKDHRMLHIELTESAKEVIEKYQLVKEECRRIFWSNISEAEKQIVEGVIRSASANLAQEMME